MKNRAKINRNSGLTLTETLAVVAIIVILIGISAVAVVRHINNLELTELDNAAREIYMAAENRAVLLSANQRLTNLVYLGDASGDEGGDIGVHVELGGPHARSDAGDNLFVDTDSIGGGALEENLYYVNADLVRDALLETGNIDPTLLEGDFYIVYDLNSGSVTDVIYAKEPGSLSTLVGDDYGLFEEYYEDWWIQDHSTRAKHDLFVGWYNGAASQGSIQSSTYDGQPVIVVEISNKEELTVTVTVYYGEEDVTEDEVRTAVEDAIRGGDLSVILGPDEDNSNIYIDLTRPIYDTRLKTDPGDKGFYDNYYSRTWVLDSVDPKNPGWKFDEFDSNQTGVIPGENFRVTASIRQDDDSILNVSPKMKRDNSLFSYNEGKGGGETAYIEYLRHLQNLDKTGGYQSGVQSVTKAVQIKDIWGDGNNGEVDENGNRKAFFTNGYDFIPIVNNDLISYNGSPDESSDEEATAETVYKIRNLKVDASQSAASGLFSETRQEGMTFQNIRLVNTTVQSTAANTSVGALAGQTYGATVIDNCWVYWEAGDGVVLENELGLGENGDPDDYTYQLAGAAVGGLVGTANGQIEITGSLAAATIKGTKYAGGLVGQMAADGNTITNSYADCYLTGGTNAQVAGLVGDVSNDVTLKKCYSAGFILGVYDKDDKGVFTAAGLCLGEGTTTANNVYTVMLYPDLSDGKNIKERGENIYNLAKKLDESGSPNNQYLAVSDADGGTVYASMTDKGDEADPEDNGFADEMNENGEDADGKFVWKTAGQSNPYNLRENLTLSIYSYPGLDGLDHYGDWGAEFKDPSLVYYEKYDAISTDAWGISGGNARNLLNVNNLKDRMVLSDGYAVAFLVDDVEEDVVSVKIKYSYTNLNGNNLEIDAFTDVTTATIEDLENSQKTMWQDDGGTYHTAYVVPLPDQLIYSNFALDCFYRYVGFELYFVHSDGKEELRKIGEYIFNPHFAEAIEIYDDGSEDDTISTIPLSERNRDWKEDGMKDYADGKANTMSSVKIRTSRHLFNLSEFSEYYNSSKRYTFSQALGLDYSTYDWQGVYDKNKTIFERTTDARENSNNVINNSGLNELKSAPYVQKPIGSESVPFTGAYEGGYNYIKNVVPDVKLLDEKNRYVGLFGYSTVRLRNIVYQMGPDEGKDEAPYQMVTNPLSGITNNLYIGGLAGGNTGTIINCAVYGVDVKTDISGVKLYVGGLVGLNSGSISSCSAESKQLVANAYNYSELYMGGFVGENGNNRTISSSYAVGRINVEVNNTKTAQICGFVGKNSGTITDAYAAVDLESGGLGVEAYGFCNEQDNGSQLKESIGYLDQGSYSYRKINYAANYKPEDEKVAVAQHAKPYNYSQLTYGSNEDGAFSTPKGMGNASDAPQTNDNSYPFPAVVKDAKGNYIHYGKKPEHIYMGDMGVLYWEVMKNIKYWEDGTSYTDEAEKGTYYIYALTVDTENRKITEISTLSKAHDDGKAVTAYGYGYYWNKAEIGETAPNTFFSYNNIRYFEYDGYNFYNLDWGVANAGQQRNLENGDKYKLKSIEANSNNYNGNASSALEDMLSDYGVIVWDSYHENAHSSDAAYADTAKRTAVSGLVPYYKYKTETGIRVSNGITNAQARLNDNGWDPTTNPATFKLFAKNTTVEFIIDPHFAASMSVKTIGTTAVRDGNGLGTTVNNNVRDWFTDEERNKLTTFPGQANNPFTVRSGTQLQAINESTRIYTDMIIGLGGRYASRDKEAYDLPDASYFPYLSSERYIDTKPNETGTGSSDRFTYSTYTTYHRYFYWEQTHDMDWTGEGNTYGDNHNAGVFTPIAATAARLLGNSKYVQLPGWFSGSYDGQNYTLKNFSIDINSKESTTSCIGLFGAVKGATLENIVMYSETGKDKVIVRGRKSGTSNQNYYQDEVGGGGGVQNEENRWYAAGVLVGVATESTIKNCAVAGYTITDQTYFARQDKYTQSITPTTIWQVRVGNNTNTNNYTYCDIYTNSTLSDIYEGSTAPTAGTYYFSYNNTAYSFTIGQNAPATNNANLKSNNYNYNLKRANGNNNNINSNVYLVSRTITTKEAYQLGGAVGGLVGMMDGTLDGCVAVTTINLRADHTNGRPANDSNKYGSDNDSKITNRGKDAPISVGGLVGSTIGDVQNCYTGGEINVSATNSVYKIGRIIGGVGIVDLESDGDPSNTIFSTTTVSACYSYMSLPSTTGNGTGVTVQTYAIGGTGDGHTEPVIANNNYYLLNVGAIANSNTSGTGVTYRQLSGEDQLSNGQDILGTSNLGKTKYAKVSNSLTTSDGSILSVPGKYSYVPQNRTDLRGLDFPFPTVLTMDGYNVHYGGWTLQGIERYGKKEGTEEYSIALGAQPADVDVFRDQGMYHEKLMLSEGIDNRIGTWKIKVNEDDTKYVDVKFNQDTTKSQEKDEKSDITYICYTTTGTYSEIMLDITALQPKETPVLVYIECTVGSTVYSLPQPITVNVTAEVKLEPGRLSMYPAEMVYVRLTPIGITEDTYSLTVGKGTSYSDLLAGYTVNDNSQVIMLATGDFGEDDGGETVWIDVPYTYTLSDEENGEEEEDVYTAEDIHGIFVDLQYLPLVGKWIEEKNESEWKWVIDLSDYIEFDKDNVGFTGVNAQYYDVDVEDNVITLTQVGSIPTESTDMTITTGPWDEGIESRVLTINVPAPIDLNPVIKWDYEDPENWILDFSEYKLNTLEVDVMEPNDVTVEFLEDGIIKLKGIKDGTESITLNVDLIKGNLQQSCILTIELPERIVLKPTVKWNKNDSNSWLIDFSEHEPEFDTLVEVKAPEDSTVTITGPVNGGKSVTLTLKDGEEVPEKVRLEVTLTKDKLELTCNLFIFLPKATVEDETSESDTSWIVSFEDDVAIDGEATVQIKENTVLTEEDITIKVEDYNTVILTLAKKVVGSTSDTEVENRVDVETVLKVTLTKDRLRQSCEFTVYLSVPIGDEGDSGTVSDGNAGTQGGGTVSDGSSESGESNQNGTQGSGAATDGDPESGESNQNGTQGSGTVTDGDDEPREAKQGDTQTQGSTVSSGDLIAWKREQDDLLGQSSGINDGDDAADESEPKQNVTQGQRSSVSDGDTDEF